MIEKSPTIALLAKALAAVQGEIENASKNSANPHFKSKYADLAEILLTARPVLAKHGLSVSQHPAFENGVVHVDTLILHASGEWLESRISTPVSKLDAQGVGSAITYCRRYALAAVVGIAQEDDDGNAASTKPAAQPTQSVAIEQKYVNLIQTAQSLPELADVWKSIPAGVRHAYATIKDERKAILSIDPNEGVE